ncbi:MarR family winged helix-turn-helix transcriptional regulator [Bordetella sp. FB-8]|uniref:MarR family winged helix-turn-helix transcriptional regulator n=1 Tax=Bordetella sp. FB-8 TaxID=1159870 RepID=UPI00036B1AF9|nr:MarR family transcriptional regulator [Bordetella sp. FB-8]
MPASAYPGHDRFLPYLINRTATQINRRLFDILDQNGLTMTHWRVLAFLSGQDGLSIGELAQATMTEQSTLSRSLRTLEGRGYVRRLGGSTDTRTVHVYLEPLGRRTFESMLEPALALEAIYMKGISERDRQTLRRLLLKVLANCEE